MSLGMVIRRGGSRRLAAVAGATLVAVVVLAGCFPLGSAGNVLGNDPTRAGTQPGFYAAINGPYSDHADGDPFATKCANNDLTVTSCDASGTNPEYTSAGYVTAVLVPASDVGSSVTVSIFDPAFGQGDAAGDGYGAAAAVGGFSTSYQLFQTTGNLADVSLDPSQGMNALGRCTGGTPGYEVFAAGTESANAWYALCTFTPTAAGIYPLQVKTSAIPGVTDSGAGFNVFSVKATTSVSAQPLVYGLDQLSLYLDNSGPSNGSWLYLAEIGASQAGHTMLVDLFDPGDGTSTSGTTNRSIQVLAPPGGVPAAVPTGGTPIACSFSDPSIQQGGATTNTSSSCTIQTSVGNTTLYNGKWLRIAITIPTSYTCTNDCWWTLRETATGSAGTYTTTDRMVIDLNVSS